MLHTLVFSDIPALIAIENEVHAHPWTAEAFEICFKAGYSGFGMKKDEQFVGFIILALGAEECHILNLGTARAYQHQGVGTQLLLYALQHAKFYGARIAYLEVRASNVHAIALYRKVNFFPTGIRKGYYQTATGHEDALMFTCEL